MSNRREENYFERKEEERQTRQDHWRVMAGMTDFFAVVIGVAVCLILVMLIVSLFNWLRQDTQTTFSVLIDAFRR
ncbi:MAG: hypothetical protein II481_05275 [Clostridia bacterium]|jgi:nitrogen fixation protein FixH|nr:hypothetical protein [Clostridia bacterium]MBR6300331.1 hypothetical protein [Clostridia bacterium]